MASDSKNSGFSSFQHRINWHGDPEPEQAIKIRLPLAVLFVLSFCVPWSGEGSFWDNVTSLPGAIFVAHLVLGLLIVVAIIERPRVSPIRRVFGITIDIGALSALMFYTNEQTVVLFFMYLWVIHGNGFRYGVGYLYFTGIVSFIGFYLATWGAYWEGHHTVALILKVILFVIPIYSAFLIKKLHTAIDAAKKANEAKSRFLANMSHELRTPLNGVIGFGELLRETNLSFDQHELVNGIHSSANTLLELIENILDISKIEAGKLVLDSQSFDLHALVTSVHFMLAPQGERKGLLVACNIDPDTPFHLIGDQAHLRQVLINLVNNAIKFTEKGSVRIKISTCSTADEKLRIRFEIEDTGIGIAPENQQKIFENFTQADAGTSRAYGGTGLGTTISKDLVELMGGEIGLTSEVGKGSLFWFELPFDVAPEQQQSALQEHHLLLLAGEEAAETIRPGLKQWGINYEWVRSGPRAFSLLVSAVDDNSPYEVVIVDQKVMSDINPIQFAQMVRAENELEALSLVLVNSSDSVIEANLLNQYYVSTLDDPGDKRLLYNAIHAAKSVNSHDANVITLAEHYASIGTAKNLDILVAEDNEVNQQVIQGILKHAGHQVTLTDSGDKALDILSEKLDSFGLLIVDMNMPGKTGLEVVKALRFMDTDNPLPVIMLSADATPQTREQALAAGVNSFLTKPVDARVLLEKIAILTKKLSAKTAAKEKAKRSHANSSRYAKIKGSPWFDEEILMELSRLGNGLQFVRGLVSGFARDGEKHIVEIKQAEVADYPAYREGVHALKGSATELGATTLVDVCLKGEAMKPYDIGSDKLKQNNREIERVFNLTIVALQEALSEDSAENPQT